MLNVDVLVGRVGARAPISGASRPHIRTKSCRAHLPNTPLPPRICFLIWRMRVCCCLRLFQVWKDESSFTISNVEAHIPGMTTYGLSGDKSETFQATCALSADSCNAMPTTKCDVLTKTPNTDFGRSIGRRELDHKGCQHLGHSCGTFNGVNYGNCCAQSEKSPPTSMECKRDGDNSLVVNGRVQYRKKCDDCFPSAATVLRLSEGTAAWTRIDSLRRGDLIAAVDEQDRFFFDEVRALRARMRSPARIRL